MASIFQNPLLSIAGQKERLANVGSTLKSAVTGQGVRANTSSPKVNAVLSAAATNPYTSALAIAVGANPSNALSAARAGFTALPTSGKVLTVAATPLVASALVSQPKAASIILSAPSAAARFGGNASDFIANPTLQGAKKVASESPLITGALALGTVATIGSGLSGTIATALNTQAVKKNTQASTNALPTSPPISTAIPVEAKAANTMVPITPATQVIGREASVTSPRARSTRKRALARKPVTNTVRVQIVNQNRNSYIGRRVSYGK